MNPEPCWVCLGCGEDHDDEDDARWCCAPRVSEQWRCTECNALHDEEPAARDCCSDEAATVSPFHALATPAELEAAGQQRLPM